MTRGVRRAVAAASLALAVVGLILLLRPHWQAWLRVPLPRTPCPASLQRADLDRSLELGAGFLLAHQTPEGRFNYEYDWRRRTLSPGDNQVRQAGATWGLALLHQETRQPELAAALDRALAFWQGQTRVRSSGSHYLVYPGDRQGSTGTVALVALALIERLRAGGLDETQAQARQAQLDGLLAFLLEARRDDGLWQRSYDHGDGAPRGGASPYFDGEALLALARAARHLGRADLVPVIMESAEAGYREHVVQALRIDPDSAETKGYYQWSSMAFYEIARSDWPGHEPYARRVFDLADWMIDVHRTLDRTRNTGYAQEGILHALDLARRQGDEQRVGFYACVADTALAKLTSWQVGHPRGNQHVAEFGGSDPLALGGIQNHAVESTLRIDVAQHQMHAVLLARRFAYPEKEAQP